MKSYTQVIMALAASALPMLAQEQPAAPGHDGGPRPPHRPPPPVVAVLDANRDGMLDADEIANASAALLKLDQNGDGVLTIEELRPPRPPRGDGENIEPRGGRPPRR